MTGATCAAGSVYPSGGAEITPSLWWGSCCLFFSFLCFCVKGGNSEKQISSFKLSKHAGIAEKEGQSNIK